jgi:hypothetical protein
VTVKVVAAVTDFLLLAQAVDPISGGAGWVGAGLLGLVLAWLLFIHLPAKDKQLAVLIENKDRQIADLVTSRDMFVRELTHNFRDAMQVASIAAALQDKERRDDYKASLATVVNHCEKETGQISDAIRKDLADLVALVVALRQLMEQLQVALRKAKDGTL